MICNNDSGLPELKGDAKLPSNYIGHLCLNSTVISGVKPMYFSVQC